MVLIINGDQGKTVNLIPNQKRAIVTTYTNRAGNGGPKTSFSNCGRN